MMRTLLVMMALFEAPLGVTLILAPARVTRLLLGIAVEGPPALVLGRVAGAAVLALGLACWLARNDGSSSATRGLLAAMLLYNLSALAVLSYAVAGDNLFGILVVPAVALHALLAGWCFRILRSGDVPPANAVIRTRSE